MQMAKHRLDYGHTQCILYAGTTIMNHHSNITEWTFSFRIITSEILSARKMTCKEQHTRKMAKHTFTFSRIITAHEKIQ